MKNVEKVAAMTFADVYPFLVQKAERKGRSREEVDAVACWLTGYSQDGLQQQIDIRATYSEFFASAPAMNPDRHLIKGVICGDRVEEMAPGLAQEVRYLDKLVDELAKGKALEKVLRG